MTQAFAGQPSHPVLQALLPHASAYGIQAAQLAIEGGDAGLHLVEIGGAGAVGARLGGAPPLRPALRELLGGAAAMAIAYLVGQAFNVSVS